MKYRHPISVIPKLFRDPISIVPKILQDSISILPVIYPTAREYDTQLGFATMVRYNDDRQLMSAGFEERS